LLTSKGTTMRLFTFRACVLSSTALVLLSFSRPAAAANSYCPGCGAAIVGVGVAVGVGVGVAIYFIHRGHTSLTGCVQQTDNGLSLTAKDGNIYSLVNAPNEVKARERLSLRGHKIKSPSGRTFRVDHVSRDYGACSP
jgi:hypothetical protein